MQCKGVSYDVGRERFGNWRPDYSPQRVRRELEIIQADLYCNAVRICGVDIERLTTSARCALEQGLEVWMSPELWNQSPETTLRYLVKAATAAEELRRQHPGQLVLLMDSELTLFMKGILPGRGFLQRLDRAFSGPIVRSGGHNQPLNEFLARATRAVREGFQGKLSHASLIWEHVDWGLFDFVGVDHYWDERIRDRYLDLLRPLLSLGKPVVITEFGFKTTKAPSMGATSLGNVDPLSRFLHQLPVIGPRIRPRLSKVEERDEPLQAQMLMEQLSLLDRAGVYGAFIFGFVSPFHPYDENPNYDLDRESSSRVRSYSGKRHGTAYPDMTWDPKESFRAIADYCART